MPYVDDYSEDDDEQGGPGSGGARISGGVSGQSLATPSKQDDVGFVPWERFVSANKDVSQRTANSLSGNVEQRAQGVKSDLDKAGEQQEKDIASNYVGGANPRSDKSQGFGIARAPVAQSAAPAESKAPKSGTWATSFGNPQPAGGGGWSLDSTVRQQEPPPSKLAAGPATQPLVIGTTSGGLQATVGPFGEGPRGDDRHLDPDRLDTDLSGGAVKTGASDLAGSKNLEEQFNKASSSGWQDFLGRAFGADQAATSLGSEGGVQALIKQNYAPPNSAFDAALVGGEGGQRFRDLSKQYGGGALLGGVADANAAAQDRWAALMGDVDRESALRDQRIADATDEMNRLAALQAQGGGSEASAPYKGNTLGSYGSYADFTNQLAAGGGLHDIAEGVSPVDAFLNKLGEAGVYDGGTVAGGFRSGVLGDKADGIAGSLDDQNRYGAFQDIEKMYGQYAGSWVWDNLTQDVWDSMSGKNSGAIYKIMADMIEAGLANGTLTRNSSGQITPVLSEAQAAADAERDAALTKTIDINTGRSSGESVTSADGSTSREMTPEQNYARAQAYQSGWGEEWDRQFLAGSDEPSNGTSQSGGSGQIIYDEDGNVIGLT